MDLRKEIEKELANMEKNVENYSNLSFDEQLLSYLCAQKLLKQIQSKLNEGFVFVKAEN